MRTRALQPTLALTLATLACAACSSAKESPDQEDRLDLWEQVSRDSRGNETEGGAGAVGEAGEAGLLARTGEDPFDQSIGLFLRGLDARIKAWNQRKLIAMNPRELSERHGLEQDIRYRVQVRFPELVEQLQLGPSDNRRIAAAALGFSDDDAALGPLVEALSDNDSEVVSNALVGLGQLGRVETPLGPIVNLLEVGHDPWIRSNSAFALKRLVEAGARDDRVAPACRRGLLDSEAGVRVQCAAVLGILVDVESIDTLSGLLHDEVSLVSLAGARSLAHIGNANIREKGRCARHLADALGSASSSVRDYLIHEMTTMSQVNYGSNVNRWQEWAYKMD